MFVVIIDRTDLEQVVVITANGEKLTRRQDIARMIEKHGYWFGRIDIALINGRNGTQFAIEPKADGTLIGNEVALSLLEQDEYDRLVDIAKRTADLAKRDPIAKWLVRQ